MKKKNKKISPKAGLTAQAGGDAKKTGISPAGDRVLIRRSSPEEMTSFGIIIPDTNKEKSEEGVIVAVGPGKRNNDGKLIPVSFSVGQKVRFSYGDDIKIDGVEHVLVHEDSITAVINR